MRRLRGQNAPAVLAAICPDREARTPEEWQRWHRTTRKAITRQLIAREPGTPDAPRLMHVYCHRRATATGSQGTGIFTHLNRPSGLA
jgi:hypothetical protein